jgi:hypothetical protein
MKIPGFTADISLKNKGLYNASGQIVQNARVLHPAGPIDLHNVVSDTVSEYTSGLGLHHPGVGNCLRRVCPVHFVHGLPVKQPCYWVVGWC